jgi:membrane-anchored mycosin MYCP
MAVVTVLLATCPSALAIPKPVVDAAALPKNPTPAPSGMVQRGECVTTAVIPGTSPGAAPSASQEMLNLPHAWEFSRGEGQTVAVIDTGVKRGPRLPNVDGGGDFLETTDGLTDCDGHGTAVAGIIAGQPGDDAFSGVAPAARVLAIRQTSAQFAPAAPGDDPAVARATIDVDTLARAIVFAADRGARVINVSVVTCLPVGKNIDQNALGAAVRYAAVEKDAVIVAAAGNATGAAGCASNPLTDASRPNDERNWAGVESVSIPSWWQPYVLSVGSVTASGQPSAFSMAGPWLGLAAPGEGVVSVSNGPDGGLTNGVPAPNDTVAPLNGTSYAAAYVSGVTALVRSRFPELTAAQVVNRLNRTANNGARSPSNLVGAGTIDPVAALTWQIPAAAPAPPPVERVPAPPDPPAENMTPRIIGFSGVAALVVLIAVTALAVRRKVQTK